MKYSLVLAIVLFPLFSIGQTGTGPDSLARRKLSDLIESWTLGIDSTADEIDIKAYNKFKSLFGLAATVEDGLNAVYQYRSEKSGLYKIEAVPKAFDEYAHDAALQLRYMRVDSVLLLNANTSDPKNMLFTLFMRVAFQKAGKYVVPDGYAAQVVNSRRSAFESKSDSAKAVSELEAKMSRRQDSVYKFMAENTVRVAMSFEGDTVRITGIRSLTDKFTCTNDADLDAVRDGEDSLRNVFGDVTAAGRPDYDLDGLPDAQDKCPTRYGTTNQGCPPSYFITSRAVDVVIGLQYNTEKISLPELNRLGYGDQLGGDVVDVLQSKKGALKWPAQISSIYPGGSYSYYFGRGKKKSGISVGFAYSRFTAEYELTEPAVYTFKAFDGVNFYRRQITVGSLKEALDYSVFNFPVLFAYRSRLDKKDKSVINLKAGPSFLLFSNTSRYNAVIDFGGLYQIDTVQKNRITYYDYFDPASKYNIYFTSARLASGSQPDADSVFRQLASKGYDFARNKSYNGTQGLSRLAVAFNASLDVQHKISEGLTIKAGVHFVYDLSLGKKEKYKPINRTTDKFESIYNSNAKSSYRTLGVNAGFVYNF